MYGREKEINLLLDLYKTTSTGVSQVAIVAGPAGIGKSALVNEIYEPIVSQGGYFVSGKFDQFEKYPRAHFRVTVI